MNNTRQDDYPDGLQTYIHKPVGKLPAEFRPPSREQIIRNAEAIIAAAITPVVPVEIAEAAQYKDLLKLIQRCSQDCRGA